MRVLHSTFSLSRRGGGVFEVLRELTAPMSAADGIEVKVIGPHDSGTESERGQWRCNTEAYKTQGPSAFGRSNSLAGLYREFAPDVAHVHGVWMHYSVANMQYCRKNSVPYLVSPHGMLDSWALRNGRVKKQIARWLFEDRHLHNAACIHALCEAEAEGIRRIGFRNPICVIPNGVAPHVPTTVPPPWANLFSSGRPVLLFLGRLHPKKGLLPFLDVWQKCRSTWQQSGWALAIGGWDQSGHQNELQEKIEALGLSDDVRLLGPLFGELKSAAFQHAKAFVLPSHSEGLPVAVLEAWAAGVPVVMTPECNLPEGFEAVAAVQIETEPAVMLKGMQSFLDMSVTSLEEMGQNGLRMVEDRFVWSHISREFEETYRWLLGLREQPDFVRYD